jgi:DNA-binding transcriptional LysR family regulator
VVIAAFFTVLRGFAGEALSSLSQTHSQLQPRVVDWDENHTMNDLQSGALDLAIVDEDAKDRRQLPGNLRFEPLVEDPFRLAVPSSWPDVRDLVQTVGHPWVDGPADSAVGHALRRMRRTTGLPFPTAHSTREFTVALSLVAAGLAAAFVPEMALAALPAPAGVRVIALAGLGSRRMGVLYRQSRNEPTPAVEAVLVALREAAGGAGHRATSATIRPRR